MGPLNFGPNYFPIKNNEKKMIILSLLLLWFLFIVLPKMTPNSKITLFLTLLMNLKNFKECLITHFPLKERGKRETHFALAFVEAHNFSYVLKRQNVLHSLHIVNSGLWWKFFFAPKISLSNLCKAAVSKVQTRDCCAIKSSPTPRSAYYSGALMLHLSSIWT